MNIVKKLLFVGLWSALCCTSVQAMALPLPGNLIALNSAAGEKMFYQSQYKSSYWPLSIQFVTQENLAYCAVASSVMVLNSLGVDAPVDPVYKKYSYFTQNNFFTKQVSQVVTADWVQHHGITLDQLAQMLMTFPVTVKVVHADKMTLAQFRLLAKQVVASKNSYIVVNFLRTGIQEEGSGHMSPVGAYDQKSDRFLLLDVARYKYPPVWVTAKDLWAAMDTVDNDAKAYRGFLLIQAKQ